MTTRIKSLLAGAAVGVISSTILLAFNACGGDDCSGFEPSPGVRDGVYVQPAGCQSCIADERVVVSKEGHAMEHTYTQDGVKYRVLYSR